MSNLEVPYSAASAPQSARLSQMQRIGNIEEVEMHRAFNMGVGLVIVASSGLEAALGEAFQPFDVWKLGYVDSAIRGVLLNWDKR